MSGDELDQQRRQHRVEKHDGRVVVIDPTGQPNEDCVRFLEKIIIRGLSTCTAEAYAYDLSLAHRWLAASELELRQLDAEQLHRFLAWERGRASHPKSINRRLHTLRLYYRFVTGRELPGGVEQRGHYRTRQRDRDLGLQRVLSSPVRNLRVKEPRTVIEPLTTEQVRDLLSRLRRYRDLGIAHAMLLCGLRSQEVLQLRLVDIDTCISVADRRARVVGNLRPVSRTRVRRRR